MTQGMTKSEDRLLTNSDGCASHILAYKHGIEVAQATIRTSLMGWMESLRQLTRTLADQHLKTAAAAAAAAEVDGGGGDTKKFAAAVM